MNMQNYSIAGIPIDPRGGQISMRATARTGGQSRVNFRIIKNQTYNQKLGNDTSKIFASIFYY